MAHGGLLSCTSISDFESVFSVNYFSCLHLIQASIRLLAKSNNSSVVLVSSSSTIKREPGSLAYSSSKICLELAVSLLACEYASSHVRFNCVAPGVTDTDMLKLMAESSIQRHLDSSSNGRIATVEEVANVIYFCLFSSLLMVKHCELTEVYHERYQAS